MQSIKEAKIEVAREWLRNHVVPQVKYDGMSSYQMAVNLVDMMEEAEIVQAERQHEADLLTSEAC